MLCLDEHERSHGRNTRAENVAIGEPARHDVDTIIRAKNWLQQRPPEAHPISVEVDQLPIVLIEITAELQLLAKMTDEGTTMTNEKDAD